MRTSSFHGLEVIFISDRRCRTPAAIVLGNMRTNQLEIRLPQPRVCAPRQARQRRQSRAHWWFEQMRRVVDEAVDRRPAPSSRPEQTHLPLPLPR